MREIHGDLWDHAVVGSVVVITTNGQVRNGRNVMGRGCAEQARDRFPGLDKRIGTLVQTHGNRCFRLGMGMRIDDQYEWNLVTYPTKHHWREPSDPGLIMTSAEQLVEMADKFAWDAVYLPRPGCGSGNLDWAEVKKLLVDILDDRFVIVDRDP